MPRAGVLLQCRLASPFSVPIDESAGKGAFHVSILTDGSNSAYGPRSGPRRSVAAAATMASGSPAQDPSRIEVVRLVSWSSSESIAARGDTPERRKGREEFVRDVRWTLMTDCARHEMPAETQACWWKSAGITLPRSTSIDGFNYNAPLAGRANLAEEKPCL
jgi:hypothetical protein